MGFRKHANEEIDAQHTSEDTFPASFTNVMNFSPILAFPMPRSAFKTAKDVQAQSLS